MAAREGIAVTDEEPDGVRSQASWPRSVDEAVERLMRELEPGSLDHLRAMERHTLVRLHFSLGLYIRNTFGLWQGNEALLDSCAAYQAGDTPQLYRTCDADEASGTILEALWSRLQEPEPPTG